MGIEIVMQLGEGRSDYRGVKLFTTNAASPPCSAYQRQGRPRTGPSSVVVSHAPNGSPVSFGWQMRRQGRRRRGHSSCLLLRPPGRGRHGVHVRTADHEARGRTGTR